HRRPQGRIAWRDRHGEADEGSVRRAETVGASFTHSLIHSFTHNFGRTIPIQLFNHSILQSFLQVRSQPYEDRFAEDLVGGDRGVGYFYGQGRFDPGADFVIKQLLPDRLFGLFQFPDLFGDTTNSVIIEAGPHLSTVQHVGI